VKPEKEISDRTSICQYIRYLSKQKYESLDENEVKLGNNLKLLADLIECEADKNERE